LQGSLIHIDVTGIMVHEADEPNGVVAFLDAEFLTGRSATR